MLLLNHIYIENNNANANTKKGNQTHTHRITLTTSAWLFRHSPYIMDCSQRKTSFKIQQHMPLKLVESQTREQLILYIYGFVSESLGFIIDNARWSYFAVCRILFECRVNEPDAGRATRLLLCSNQNLIAELTYKTISCPICSSFIFPTYLWQENGFAVGNQPYVSHNTLSLQKL